MLKSQNASNLAFSPLEICLGKEKGENRKKAVETRQNVGFPHPGIHLWEAKGGSGKVRKISRKKLTFQFSMSEDGKRKSKVQKKAKVES